MTRLLPALCVLASCESATTMPPPGDGSAAGDGQSIDTIASSYAAWSIAGGLDRIRIGKLETATCYEIQLSYPSTNASSLTLPASWAFEHARAKQPSGACDPRYLGPVAMMFDASDVTGVISWQVAGVPTIIESVQVTLSFTNPPTWVAPSTTFSATNLEVTP